MANDVSPEGLASQLPSDSDWQQRLDQLEMTCAYQQDTIETLNRTVGQQHQQLQLLQKQPLNQSFQVYFRFQYFHLQF